MKNQLVTKRGPNGGNFNVERTIGVNRKFLEGKTKIFDEAFNRQQKFKNMMSEDVMNDNINIPLRKQQMMERSGLSNFLDDPIGDLGEPVGDLGEPVDSDVLTQELRIPSTVIPLEDSTEQEFINKNLGTEGAQLFLKKDSGVELTEFENGEMDKINDIIKRRNDSIASGRGLTLPENIRDFITRSERDFINRNFDGKVPGKAEDFLEEDEGELTKGELKVREVMEKALDKRRIFLSTEEGQKQLETFSKKEETERLKKGKDKEEFEDIQTEIGKELDKPLGGDFGIDIPSTPREPEPQLQLKPDIQPPKRLPFKEPEPKTITILEDEIKNLEFDLEDAEDESSSSEIIEKIEEKKNEIKKLSGEESRLEIERQEKLNRPPIKPFTLEDIPRNINDDEYILKRWGNDGVDIWNKMDKVKGTNVPEPGEAKIKFGDPSKPSTIDDDGIARGFVTPEEQKALDIIDEIGVVNKRLSTIKNLNPERKAQIFKKNRETP